MSQDDPLQRPVSPPRQDNHGPIEFGARLADDVVMALRFFSRLPTGDRPHELPNLSRIALALPFASLVIGLLPVFVMMGGVWLSLPPFLAAVLGVIAGVVVTGAMAEDALADSMDGLFGGQHVERRLEIMKDSRHGTYGVCAIVLLLAVRITALGAVAALNPLVAGGIWMAAMVLSRSFSLWLTVELPSARADGASAAAGRVGKRVFGIGMGLAVLIGFAAAAPATSFLAIILAVLAAGLVAIGWTAVCRRLVGGQTGDLIGALQALVEVAVLAVLVAFA
ncbi:MAG: adenosylcobinamide-GDP ribazoletransferase [Hyphomicrobiales bacterium]|nr:MAG: adenosylcobinamide-GDP ribazoletransferase [Hyphomicrobiales bacterium]